MQIVNEDTAKGTEAAAGNGQITEDMNQLYDNNLDAPGEEIVDESAIIAQIQVKSADKKGK